MDTFPDFSFIFLKDEIIYSLSAPPKTRPLWSTPSGKLISLKTLCWRDAAKAFYANIKRDSREILSRIMMKIMNIVMRVRKARKFERTPKTWRKVNNRNRRKH
jgi:hypothetical protein